MQCHGEASVGEQVVENRSSSVTLAAAGCSAPKWICHLLSVPLGGLKLDRGTERRMCDSYVVHDSPLTILMPDQPHQVDPVNGVIADGDKFHEGTLDVAPLPSDSPPRTPAPLVSETSNVTRPPMARNAVATATRYAELSFHKSGGLGALFRARDKDLHRDVVIKFIHERCRVEPEILSQFHVEAEVTGRLDHPGVVPVYGIGQDWDGQPFYVMRMIHGRELQQAIQEYHEAGGPASRSRENRQRLFALLEHLVSACNTVAYAHDVGIIHCDLKPANIMIGKYGETFVLDWGLATSFERTATFVEANEPSMRPRSAESSHPGQRGGTLGYISPEQLSSDGRLAPTSDVYSLGASLYEILLGSPPFNGRDTDVVEQIRQGQFQRPRDVNRRVSRRLEAICLKAMSLAQKDRYRTAKQLAADLKNWMRDDEVQAAPDNVLGRVSRHARRHRGITISVFLAVLFATAVGTWCISVARMPYRAKNRAALSSRRRSIRSRKSAGPWPMAK